MKNAFRRPHRRGGRLPALLAALSAGLLAVSLLLFFQDISSEIAVSDASDAVSVRVNRAIAEIMREEDWSGASFVVFEKSDSGDITAVSSNVAKINELSAAVLERVIGATENDTLSVSIPAGNFTGLGLLSGRGPQIPIKIVMLTTSSVGFNSSIVTAGINQSRHRIELSVSVDVDILVPWCKRSTTVLTDVLIADTVIVGKVPETYLNTE